jgi:hypothetical protein
MNLCNNQFPNACGASGSNFQSGRWLAAAWVLWLVPMVVIAILVIARPDQRTLTLLYQKAVKHWWSQQALYEGPAGMNYLPHFAVLYSPYDVGGRVVGAILWRWTAAAGIAAGLWFFCRTIGGPQRTRTFVIVSAISLPLALPALQNGQANAHLGAALLLAAWCLKAQRWNAAVACLWLATCIKPLGLAAVGLAWAAYPHLGWRLACGFGAFLGFPFLFGPPGYVWSQYVGAWENLRQCSEVTEHRFADLNGLLRTFGFPLSGKASLAVRASAGAVLMLVCWRASRHETETRRALVWLSAAAGFLMLFNPMTEANSYAILAPVLGLMAGWEFHGGRARFGWVFAGMALTMGLLPNLLRPLFGDDFALAWHPAMTLGFLTVVAWQTFQSDRLDAGLPRPAVVSP